MTIPPPSSRRTGFTLVELLTVLAIIGVLAAILIPVVGKIQISARSAECTGNLRQWGVLLNIFQQENDGALPNPWLPPESNGNAKAISWTDLLVNKGLLTEDESYQLMVCPNTDCLAGPGTICYGMSRKVTPVTTEPLWYPSRIINPSDTILLGDVGINPNWGYKGEGSGGVAIAYNGSRNTDRLDFRETGGATNALFADGHVQALIEEEVTQQMFEPYKIVQN